jgi:hypothetical protein
VQGKAYREKSVFDDPSSVGGFVEEASTRQTETIALPFRKKRPSLKVMLKEAGDIIIKVVSIVWLVLSGVTLIADKGKDAVRAIQALIDSAETGGRETDTTKDR